jgi:acetoin utilization protein AcuC
MLIAFVGSRFQLMSKTAVFFGEELAKYGFGETHPFNSNRIYSFWSKFCALNLDKSDQIQIERPEIADEALLSRFHDAEYIDLVKKSSKLGSGFLDLGDTPAFRGVFESSSYVVGTSLKALELVMEKTGGILHAFNPIGGLHHARRGSAGGFCVFNDIGVVVLIAREKYGIKKIAYVDIDAHHGDGVYYEFENDPNLYIADIHEDGRYLYPGTGAESEIGLGNARGTKLNIQMKPNSDDNDFFSEFKRIEEFISNVAKPELIIFQCGADCMRGDPLTHLQYSSRAHKFASNVLHRLSHEHSEGRIVALGGGGYNLANIANAWTEIVKSLIDDAL